MDPMVFLRLGIFLADLALDGIHERHELRGKVGTKLTWGAVVFHRARGVTVDASPVDDAHGSRVEQLDLPARPVNEGLFRGVTVAKVHSVANSHVQLDMLADPEAVFKKAATIGIDQDATAYYLIGRRRDS